MADYNVDGYRFAGPEGLTEAQQRKVVAEHTDDAPQTLKFDRRGNQIDEEPWDPHREEKFDEGWGQILPSVGRAAKAFGPSVARMGTDLWYVIKNYSEVYQRIKQLGFEGVAKEIGNDLLMHYGSLEKARRTFETDPARFMMDISAPFTGGGTALAKLPGWAARVGRTASTVGRAIDPLAMTGRVASAVAREPAAQLLGRTTRQGAQSMRRAEEAGYQGIPSAMPQRLWPTMPHVGPTGLGIFAELGDQAFGHPVAHHLAQHPVLTGIGATLAASRSPRAAGATMYGLGAAQRRGEQLAPVARSVAFADPRHEQKTKQMYNVTVDGETYKFEGPEGMSEAEQRREVQEHTR
jgi:hypothetical protein